jgi:hypothetical protein
VLDNDHVKLFESADFLQGEKNYDWATKSFMHHFLFEDVAFEIFELLVLSWWCLY